MEIQCLGSSHSRRLVEHLQRHQRSKSSRLKCVFSFSFGGAQLVDMKRRIKEECPPISADFPLIVFIGGNDILQAVPLEQVKNRYKSLIRLLRRRYPDIRLVLTCMPIFPRCQGNFREVSDLENFNKFVASFSNDKTAIVPLNKHVTTSEYFIKRYPHSGRADLLHLNKKGYDVLVGLLSDCLLVWKSAAGK